MRFADGFWLNKRGYEVNYYSFGEKFTSFVKNRQNIQIWNSDGGT